ncbi:MAG: HPP family protein [Halorientalis sp.]
MDLDPRDRVRGELAALGRRLRRVERREVDEFRRWIENTDNLLHLTVLVAVPLLIALVTYLSNAIDAVSFLLFPPLASGAYTLFADPGGRHSSPRRFVGGLFLGAACGVAAVTISARLFGAPPSAATAVHAPSAALAVLLTALSTWAFDMELPTAFSTALLVLVTGVSRLEYVLGMVLSALLVAGVFVVWREEFYEERARYLYGAVGSDDHVLVPMRGDHVRATVALGARLAAAHEAGKVVLLDVVEDERVAAAAHDRLADDETARRLDGSTGQRDPGDAEGDAEQTSEADAAGEPSPAVDEAAERLEREADRVRRAFGVPCEVVVAAGDPVEAVRRTAEAANCDLVATSFETEAGAVTPFVRGVLGGGTDAVALRSTTDAEAWPRILVMVARPGDAAHAMIDFAARLAAGRGRVSVCTCIDDESERRRAEATLANLAETTEPDVETRVARSSVDAFVDANADVYDLLLFGASRERSRASRFVVPPLFERIEELDPDCDVAVVGRG